MAELVIDEVAVEVHLAGVLEFGRAGLEVHHNEPAQTHVIEEQVEVEVVVGNAGVDLPADEGEALAQFEEEYLDWM
mgnify:CR=1 FL=1